MIIKSASELKNNLTDISKPALYEKLDRAEADVAGGRLQEPAAVYSKARAAVRAKSK